MKVVILAGGFGTRISEESHLKPKPMIEIGGKPILWHIMKYYYSFGFNEFIILAGYKQEVVKSFFSQYLINNSDVSFDFSNTNQPIITQNSNSEKWKVTIVNTGLYTMTGGRIKRIENLIGNEQFMLTYGDGLSNVDLNSLKYDHKSTTVVTLTAIKQTNRFGTLKIGNDKNVLSFAEKNIDDGYWINGGFMIVNPSVFKYIKGDDTNFEKDVLSNLASEKKIMAHKHEGFWQSMDTLRDKNLLESIWENGNAPWKIWN